MRIYRKGGDLSAPSYSVFATPGALHPGTSDFLDAEGKPIMFDVTFKYGVADVPDNLGRFMLDQNLAQSTALFIPRGL